MPKYLGKNERKDTIATAIMSIVVRGEPHPGSFRIAREIGMQPSTHLRNLLWEMVDDGILNPLIRKRGFKWALTNKAIRELDQSLLEWWDTQDKFLQEDENG